MSQDRSRWLHLIRHLLLLLLTGAIIGLAPSRTEAGDLLPPTVSITAPSNGATVFGGFAVTADAADDVGVVGVQFLLDGAPLGAEDPSTPYAVVWSTAPADNGSHTLAAQARDAAGHLTISSTRTVTVLNDGSPAQIGQWAPRVTLPVVAIHMTLLPNGKILLWDTSDDHDGPPPDTTPRVWDPSTNVVVDVPKGESVLFCAHQVLLSDGRVFISGGHGELGGFGTVQASRFDPITNLWSRVADMRFPRWYLTDVLLGDGRVLTLSGAIAPNAWADVPEVYDPVTNTWTVLRQVNTSDAHTTQYLWAHILADGTIYVISPDDGHLRLLNLATLQWQNVGSTPMRRGTAAMYLPDKLLMAGGRSGGDGTPAQATAMIIDLTQPGAAWRATTSMLHPRFLHNLVVLPDGTVLAIGGASTGTTGATSGGVLPAEMWSPTSEAWTQLAAMQDQRLYHSTALLLPDGRVVAAGGGGGSALINYLTAEIYSPPYLFHGPRPVVTSVPSTINYGQSFTVQTPDADAIASVAMIPLGSITHVTDTSQRYVPLSFTKGPGHLVVQAPTNPNEAPPTYYMLFILNSAGVPAIAPIVQLPQLPPGPPAPPEAYLETGGQVVMEAEHYDQTISRGGQDWVVEASKSGFSRSGYLRILPDLDTQINAGYVGTATEIVFNIQFTTSGTYYVWLRGHADDGGDDSVHAGLDGAGPASADRITGFQTSDWVWKRDTMDGVPATLVVPSAGLHTFHLWMREDGLRVDKILLRTSSSATAPSGIGPVESVRTPSSPPPPDNTPPSITGVAASNVTTTGATLTWTTNEPATSQVEYGPTAAYGSLTALDPALGSSHSVALTGLPAGASIHYRVRSKDGAGNEGLSPDGVFVTAGGAEFAVSVDGVNDWMEVAPAPSLPLAEATVSWWVNVPTADFNDWADWWALQTAGGEYVAEIDGNGNPALYPIGTVSGASVADTIGHDLRGTGWHHLAAVMSTTAGAVRLYLDGALVGSGAWAAGGSTTGCMIGTRLNDGGGSRNIHSTIDEVRLYARALSAAEILAQYNAGQGTYGQPGESGLVAGWHLDEGGSTTAADYSGHGHSATLRNGPVWVAGKAFAPPSGDLVPPVITNVAVSGITSTGAVIAWTTNEPATSQVEYGTSTAYGQTSPTDATLVISHSVTLTGLNAGTLYHFRVHSVDASNNAAASGDGTFTTASTPPPGTAFQESGGQVVIEAEHFDQTISRSSHNWLLNTSQTGFSGSGYMEALPNTGANINTGYTTTSPEFIFKVQFTTTGTYYVWVRGAALSGSDDSCHAGLDGVGPASADRIDGFGTDWTWKRDTMDSAPAMLVINTTGLHTIHLWMREDGLRVDRVLLRKSSSSTPPSGQGPAESPRQ